MFGYNKQEELAAAINSAVRHSPKDVPYESLDTDKVRVDQVYRHLQMLGGKKPFFESKSDFICRAIVYTPDVYVVFSEFIELCATYKDGSKNYWYGDGSIKNMEIEALLESDFPTGVGLSNNFRPLIRIYINRIFQKIEHLLQSQHEEKASATKEVSPFVTHPPIVYLKDSWDSKIVAMLENQIREDGIDSLAEYFVVFETPINDLILVKGGLTHDGIYRQYLSTECETWPEFHRVYWTGERHAIDSQLWKLAIELCAHLKLEVGESFHADYL